MEIVFTKGEERHRILCRRADASTTTTSINAQLPAHDLAHFVVESGLGMQAGFYGNIAAGYSIEQLSDKTVIANLPLESMVAEVLTRAMQGMSGPGADAQNYLDLINWELETLKLPKPEVSLSQIERMAKEFAALIGRWNLMTPGEEMVLNF